MVNEKSFATDIHIVTAVAFAGGNLTSKDIARTVNSNPAYVRKRVGVLTKLSLLTTKKGIHGGVCLAKAPKDITLDMIFQATQSKPILTWHDRPAFVGCAVSLFLGEVLTPALEEASQAYRAALAKVSVQDLLDVIRMKKEERGEQHE